jgi:hypothetical protein
MSENIVTGKELNRQSICVFRKYPNFSIPLLTCWFLCGPLILYAGFYFPLTFVGGGPVNVGLAAGVGAINGKPSEEILQHKKYRIDSLH